MEKIEKIKEYIQKSSLSKNDKDIWNSYLEYLNLEQLDFLLEELGKNPNSLIKFNEDIQIKKEVLSSGSDEEWEDIIKHDLKKIEQDNIKST